MLNTIERRGHYTTHRIEEGAPVVVDPAVGSMNALGAMSTKGWRVAHGFVKLTGGASPTIKLQMLNAICYEDYTETDQSALLYFGEETAILSDGDDFYFAVGEGRILLRIAELTGSPTRVEVMLAGDSREPASLGLDPSGNKVELATDTIPDVANTPVSVTDVSDNLTHLLTGSLVIGARYRLTVLPWDLAGNPATPEDFIRGVYKMGGAGDTIASLADGDPIFSNSPEMIRPVVGKDRVHFMRDDKTALDCKVYLNRRDK